MNAICKDRMWIKCVFATKFIGDREIKGLETDNVFRLILSEKNCYPRKTIRQLSISDIKMLLCT